MSTKHCNFLLIALLTSNFLGTFTTLNVQIDSPTVGRRAHERVGPMKGFEFHGHKEIIKEKR
jgi:hypothetical protein